MPKVQLIQFLALSLISGFVELGVIIHGVAAGSGLMAPFALALAYQLGNLVPNPLPLRRLGFALLALATPAVLLIAPPADGLALWPLCLATAMVSALINAARLSLGKAAISTTLKRSFRVVGFLCSVFALMHSVLLAVLILSALLAGLILWRQPETAVPAPQTRPAAPHSKTMSAALVLHQMHYFSYCTLVLVVLVMQLGPIWAAPIFVLGWLSYISVPHIIGSRYPAAPVVIGAHFALALVLLALGAAPHASPLWIVLWIATGLFGGTVVYLTRLAETDFRFSGAHLTTFENLGHVFGALLALLWVALKLPLDGLMTIAAGFAIATAILTWLAITRKSAEAIRREVTP